MAAPALSPAQFEYVRIFDLPKLPDELRGHVLFSRANFIRANASEAGGNGSNAAATSTSASSSNKDSGPGRASGGHPGRGRGKSSSAGFNYSKALSAALDGSGSSVTSRGDGKFQDGRDFAVSDAPGGRAKLVHLTPEALAPDNAERTLQQLDAMQRMAGSHRPQQAAAAAAAAGAPKPATASLAQARSVQQQHAAALAAAANVLYDIDDGDDAGGGGIAAAAASDTSAPRGTPPLPPPSPPAGLRAPEYTLRELPPPPPPPDGPTGQCHQGRGQLEVSVLLPDVSSPGEVDVWLGAGGVLQVAVPGKYHLKLDLPHPVLDDTSHAKWSKAKKRLTLTLTKV
ncbi:hypothetical protein PLESTB_001539800 [Pleodorina starrii]|uniref:PIH1D1/2/3 CS-like domain-containing protein n=1 Tax=Pleodorina starrii TaxID=330485 RepID=A0A9W6BXT5_9CHLO|nr:hypothetical protein PLESTM_001932100 [Pleodorina starrii]GLC59825.1 hypothetical protein PLESTB_001539800 [Pleodorina starrii]GLC67293.1 hypothetical protein PLESTF_000539200 [Pleodorina starrii]